MKELNNLDQLADKIYQEGIEKAQRESKAILSAAEAERAKLLAVAKEEAKKIVTDAKREADRIARSNEQEIIRKGKQLISDLKVKIHQVVADKVLVNNTQAALADVSFLQQAILEAIHSWEADSLELVLPQKLENKLEEAFQNSVREHAKKLIISFDDRMSEGFKITERDQAYQISFTENDFIELFTPYLEEQTAQLLFTSEM
ncbi:MAG: V-type ATP synthase subunit E [Cyclobacteriaceae bacterium]